MSAMILTPDQIEQIRLFERAQGMARYGLEKPEVSAASFLATIDHLVAQVEALKDANVTSKIVTHVWMDEARKLRVALQDVINCIDSDFGPGVTDANFPAVRALLKDRADEPECTRCGCTDKPLHEGYCPECCR